MENLEHSMRQVGDRTERIEGKLDASIAEQRKDHGEVKAAIAEIREGQRDAERKRDEGREFLSDKVKEEVDRGIEELKANAALNAFRWAKDHPVAAGSVGAAILAALTVLGASLGIATP